jgi:hypothetical protein
MSERKTVDGAMIAVGHVVWRVRQYMGIRQLKLRRHHLGLWWSMISKEIYSTERAAILAALDIERDALRKAKTEARRATGAMAKLAERLNQASAPNTRGEACP